MSIDNDFSNTIVRLPRLNEPAADFHVPTTHGEKKLSDYNGRWLILFSHPAGQSVQEAEERTASGQYGCKDRCFCTRRLMNQSEPIGKL